MAESLRADICVIGAGSAGLSAWRPARRRWARQGRADRTRPRWGGIASISDASPRSRCWRPPRPPSLSSAWPRVLAWHYEAAEDRLLGRARPCRGSHCRHRTARFPGTLRRTRRNRPAQLTPASSGTRMRSRRTANAGAGPPASWWPPAPSRSFRRLPGLDRGRLSDQRDGLLKLDRAAGPPDRHRRRTDRLRAEPSLSAPGQPTSAWSRWPRNACRTTIPELSRTGPYCGCAREGIRLLERTPVPSPCGPRRRRGLRWTLRPPRTAQRLLIAGSALLLAVGRRPAVEGLGAGGGRHRLRPASGITVDRRLRRTSNRRVFAAGDVAGGFQFTHVAGLPRGRGAEEARSSGCQRRWMTPGSAVGHLHRPGAGPRRTGPRRRRAKARHGDDPGPALAIRRERPGALRNAEEDGLVKVGDDARVDASSGREHRRTACR